MEKLERKKLKVLREIHGRTLQQVADAIDVSKPYYWQIEKGKRGLSYELAVKISSYFKTTPDQIFLPEELTKSEQAIVSKEVI